MKEVEPAEPRPSILHDGWRGIREALIQVFSRLSRGPRWLLGSTALAVALSLCITFPRISFFTGKDSQIVNFWPVVEAQMEAPFSPTVDRFNDLSDHSAKRAFRLTLPLLGRLFHLSWWGLLLVQFALGVLLLYVVGRIALALFGDRVVATALVFALACTYMGKAAFLQLGGMGDGVALAFFALAAYRPAAAAVFVAVVLAGFTDERALAAAPLLGLYWSIRDGGALLAKETKEPVSSVAIRLHWTSSRALAVYAAVAFCLVMRLALTAFCGLHVPLGSQYGVGLKPLFANLGPIQSQLPRSLAGFWLWVAVAGWLLGRRRQWLPLLLGGGLSLAVIGAAMLAYDLDRGLLYLFPVVLIAWAVTAQAGFTTAELRELAVFCFLVCFIVPVNALLGSPTNRYSEGNVLPVEIVRFFHYWRMP